VRFGEVGGTEGRARRSMRVVAAITTHAIQYIARQPRKRPTQPLIVRERSIPSRRPVDMKCVKNGSSVEIQSEKVGVEEGK
jgi:hypothetical protein